VVTSAGDRAGRDLGRPGHLPLVFVTEIGVAVAFGVLLDTFVVRSVLVTARNLDVGRRIWWPSSLSPTEDVTSTSRPSSNRQP
jgi:putative drug exporter of the RND superfamily